ncbi:MAG: TadE/TadG family type IV pilus assembly protein [Candidatus Sericytochromatia bacterium]
MNINKIKYKRNKKGQALVETAIVVPLLTFLLVGIGYFGSLLTIQHNLTAAARYATRIVAMESTQKNLDKEEGTYFIELDEKTFKNYAEKTLQGFDTSRLKVEPLGITEMAMIRGSDLKGEILPIPVAKGYAFIYKYTGTAKANSNNVKGDPVKSLLNIKVGVGNIFFAAKYSYRLTELNWMSKFLFQREGITINAVSVMPAELPLRGGLTELDAYGLMNINKGIFDIIRFDVHPESAAGKNQYDDLVPPPDISN